MRRTSTPRDDRRQHLAELRRVLRVVEHRGLRDRLLALVDDLEHDADWDPVQEIRATHELADLAAELDAARREQAALLASIAAVETDLGRIRRERDDARRRLAELREQVRPELPDELVQLRVRLEADRPTDPPLLALAQAERLARAARSTLVEDA